MPGSAALGRITRTHCPGFSLRGQCGGHGACPALTWVRRTGRLVDLREEPWLRGPIGEAETIGPEYLNRLAEKSDQTVRVNAAGAGLTPEFSDLRADAFDPARV